MQVIQQVLDDRWPQIIRHTFRNKAKRICKSLLLGFPESVVADVEFEDTGFLPETPVDAK